MRSSAGTTVAAGATGTWLGAVVALPLLAVAWESVQSGPGGFWSAVTTGDAVATLRTTVLLSLLVTVINMGFGLLVAWVLVRDDFPGKRAIDLLIDLPFALPTIVASMVLVALYGRHGPLDLQYSAAGVTIALLFVTLPFVVRAVQPVLLESDADAERAAASLGAGGTTIFGTLILPALVPSLLTGAGLAFCRAVSEYGSVLLIGGMIPGRTEVSSGQIADLIGRGDRAVAAAVAVVLLVVSFALLTALKALAARSRGRAR